jgi:predicted dehydrogenase
MLVSDLRAVVVGLGFVGRAHVEALRRLGVTVSGVVGSSPDRVAADAAALGIPQVYSDLDAVLTDDAVDVVHIASPNHLHCSQAGAVLAAGKHLVVEKPLGRDSTETGQLLEQARRTDRVNAVCFNLRYYPLNQQIAAMVEADQIGTPRLVTGAYLQDWLLYDTDWNWRVSPTEGGMLRAVADIGSHWFDLAQFTTGQQIVEVCADLHTFIGTRWQPDPAAPGTHREVTVNSDDAAGVLVRFENGGRGIVSISQVSAGRKNSLSIEVDGSDGSLAWTSERAEELWVGHRDRPNEVMARDPGLVDASVRRHVGYPGGHPEGYADTFRAFFKDVYSDIAAGGPSIKPTYPTLLDGHKSLLLAEAVARSAAERRWVDVTQVQEHPSTTPSTDAKDPS